MTCLGERTRNNGPVTESGTTWKGEKRRSIMQGAASVSPYNRGLQRRGSRTSNVVGYTRNCTYRVGVKDSRGETMDRYCDHMWTPCREEHAHTLLDAANNDLRSRNANFFHPAIACDGKRDTKFLLI